MERNIIRTDKGKLLSVIIPVYNGSKYLEQAVRSVLLQPCKDVQVIIVNDGSTDDSLEIAEKIAKTDNRVIVLNQENQGVSAARNNGIEYCIHLGVSYIAFLDADDVWAKNFYTDDLMHQMTAEHYDAYHFTWYTTNESMTRGRKFAAEHNIVRPARSARFGSHFCSYLYRAELLQKYQIRFPVGIRVQEDCVFMYIFFTVATELKHDCRAFFFYRSNSSSTLHAKHDALEWYMHHIIPAWKWAENELKKICHLECKVNNKDIGGCQTMQKTYVCEMIASACKQGTNTEHITECITSAGYLQLFHNDSDIWLDSHSQSIWNSFWSNQRAVWLKYRALGLLHFFASLFRNSSLLQRIRYSNEISTLIAKEKSA